jgi:hypothetical protein
MIHSAAAIVAQTHVVFFPKEANIQRDSGCLAPRTLVASQVALKTTFIYVEYNVVTIPF